MQEIAEVGSVEIVEAALAAFKRHLGRYTGRKDMAKYGPNTSKWV